MEKDPTKPRNNFTPAQARCGPYFALRKQMVVCVQGNQKIFKGVGRP
jgi:hypothetical protein